MRDLLSGVVRNPVTWVVCVLVAAGAGFALYQLAPWTALQSSTVNEEFPGAAAATASASGPSDGRSATAAPAATGDLARGTFIR